MIEDKDVITAIENIGAGCTSQIYDEMMKNGTITPEDRTKLSDRLGNLTRYRFITYTEFYRIRYYHMIGTDPKPNIIYSMYKISDFIGKLEPGTEITVKQVSKVAGCSYDWARRILNKMDNVVIIGKSRQPKKYYAGASV